MKDRRDTPKTKEQQRMEQLHFIMEHWDDLPKAMQNRFEVQIQTIRDLLPQKKE